MTSRIASSQVMVAGRIPPEVRRAFRLPATQAQSTQDALGADSLAAHILILGEGFSTGINAASVQALRENAPALRIYRIRSTPYAEEVKLLTVDAELTWPEDAQLIDSLARQHSLTKPAIHWQRTGYVLASAAAVGGVWWVVSRADLVPAYLLPSPDAVLAEIAASPGGFASHTLTTASEALAGFLIGNALAFVTAVLLFRSRALHDFSIPLLLGLQAIPILALAPLLSVWLGTGEGSKIVMAAIVCYFPLLSNLLNAFRSVDRDLSELFAFHRANYGQTLTQLLIPASYPALQSGLRISGGLAVVGAIVAEFTGASRGLGYVLLNATYRFETDRLFAAIGFSMLLGILFANIGSLVGRLIPGAHRASFESGSAR
jgi:ABC-type nitrate/sulfonate/bicarbonate transport system permease component